MNILFLFSGEGLAGIFVLLVFGIIGGFLYFIPAIIAGSRGHHNTIAIAALNLLLGWTFLGWIGALVWSLTSTNQRR